MDRDSKTKTTLCCPNGNFSHGKFGSLSLRKASWMGISPMANQGRFRQGKSVATESRYPTLTNNESAWWVFSCFHNPPNSDMDYRIFNVRTWLFLCVRGVHMGVGHTDSESAHFWFGGGKLPDFSCAPDAGRVWTSYLWISNLTLYQLSHPVIHNKKMDLIMPVPNSLHWLQTEKR